MQTKTNSNNKRYTELKRVFQDIDEASEELFDSIHTDELEDIIDEILLDDDPNSPF